MRNFSHGEKLRLTSCLADYVSDHKKQLIEKILAERTRFITIVLEDFYKSHNASAIMRTAECYGIQDIHVIENENPYKVNPYVLRGAMKWLNLISYTEQAFNTSRCVSTLRKKGYRIVATSLSEEAISLKELQINQKTAIIFGSEHSGISEYSEKEADCLVNIPMYGFTESFNVSVSAAICIEHCMDRIRASNIPWQLSDFEKEELRFDWYCKIPARAESLIKNFSKNFE